MGLELDEAEAEAKAPAHPKKKKKVGRPLTYVVESELASPTSRPYQSLQRRSSAAGSKSTGPGWPTRSAPSPFGNTRSPGTCTSGKKTSSTGRTKELPGSIDEEADKGDDDKAQDEKQAIIRARNKDAATRYRAKTQASIATMEEAAHYLSIRRQALMACADQLCDEVFSPQE